jgi:hypothetical protein
VRSSTRVVATILVLVGGSVAVAQSVKPGVVSPSAVDVVTLKTGKSLRGGIAFVGDTGPLTMVVSREWLAHSNAGLLVKAATAESAEQAAAWTQLRDRLKKLLATPPAEPRLVFFFKQELERIEALLARGKPPEAPQFVWLDVDRDTVSRIHRAAADAQRVAMWSWDQRLPHVETRDVQDLQRELKKRGVDATAPPPDLSERLAARSQDEREWTARLALVEYTLNKPLDFQGTGDVLVRSDVERNAANLAPILTKVLSSQVYSLLKEFSLDGRPPAAPTASKGDWLKSATREADQLAIHGLRATRVELNLEGRQAVVQTAFAARLPNGSWETIWSDRESQDSTKPRADVEARIAEDPQIKQALAAMKSLGLGADDQVQQAIRFGAATMAAQQAADAKFSEFRDRYVKRLDGPPLRWTK